MKKIKMEIVLEYDVEIMHSNDKEARDWFFTEILKKDRLALYSNAIGDAIGDVKVLKIFNEKKTKTGGEIKNEGNFC